MTNTNLLQYIETVAQTPGGVSYLRRLIWNMAVHEGLASKNSQHWKQATFSDICLLEFGDRITKGRNAGTKHPVYGGGDATFRTDKYNREDRYVISRFAMSEKCVRFVSGKFWLIDSGGTYSIQKKYADKVLEEFVGVFLLSAQKRIYDLSRGMAQRNLDVGSFKLLTVPIPSIIEQRQIVAKVDELMKLCAKLESAQIVREESRRQLATGIFGAFESTQLFDKNGRFMLSRFDDITACSENIKPLRQAILDMAMCGKLTTKKSSRIKSKAISKKLKWVKIGEVCEVQKGTTPRREWYTTSGAKVIKFRDLTASGIVWTNKRNAFVPEQYVPKLKPLRIGMTLMSADAHTPKYIGKKVCFVNQVPHSSAFFSAELIAFFPKDEKVIHRQWPYFWLQSALGYAALQKRVVGKHLNSNPAKLIMMPLPSLVDQERILAQVNKLMALCDKLESALVDLETNRQQYLHAYTSAA